MARNRRPNTGLLYPAAGWDGSAGSGYGVAGGASIPTGPVGTEFAILRHLFVPWTTFTDDYDMVVGADAFDGIASVTAYCEGATQTETTPAWHSYTNSNGTTSWRYGYKFTLDWSVIVGLQAAGSMEIYFKATTNNGAIEDNVIGPYYLYARQTGVGAVNEFDISMDVDPLGAVVPGVSYTTMEAALKYAYDNNYQHARVRLTRTSVDTASSYKNITGTIGRAGVTSLYTIEPATGVDAIIGDYTVTQTTTNIDGLRWRNANGGTIQLNLCGMATLMPGLGVWSGGTGSNNIWIADGIEITQGDASVISASYSGSGAQALREGYLPGSFWLKAVNSNPVHWNVLDCNIHDVASYGFYGPEMFMNNILDNVSGSGIENPIGAVHNNQISRVGGVQAGLRTFKTAFTLAYTGAGSATFEKPGANGITSGGLVFKVDGVTVYTLTLTTSPTVKSLSDIVTEINGEAALADWTAAYTPDTLIMAPAFLAKNTLSPSSNIPSTAITSTAFQFYTIMDIHSNAITWHSTYRSNLLIDFNTVYNIIQTANLTLILLDNVSVRYNIFQDTSSANGYAPQTSSWGWRDTSDKIYEQNLMYKNTFLGTGNGVFITSPSGGHEPLFDQYTLGDHNSFVTFTKGNTGSSYPALDYDSFASGTTPAVATNSLNQGGAAESTLYVDPGAVPPDATPKAPLLLSDGEYAGAVALIETTANRGWNL